MASSTETDTAAQAELDIIPDTSTPSKPASTDSLIKIKKQELDEDSTSPSAILRDDTHVSSPTEPSSSAHALTIQTRSNSAFNTPTTVNPYTYGAAFTHASRTRRPNISEDDGMFILSHVIYEFDRLPLNVSVKKLPMTFWQYPLESWNKRLIHKQLPPASSEETVRTFYYNNLKTYRGICNMLRVPNWSFNEQTMELEPPSDVDREELYTPEGKKIRGLMKRFPYMKHFRILEVLIENREQGIVKDLNTIMAEMGVDGPEDLDYESEASADTNAQSVSKAYQKECNINADASHENLSDQDNLRIQAQQASKNTKNIKNPFLTPESLNQDLQHHHTNLNSELRPAPPISATLTQLSSSVHHNNGRYKRGQNQEGSNNISLPSFSESLARASQAYQDGLAFSPGLPFPEYPNPGLSHDNHFDHRGSGQGLPLPPFRFIKNSQNLPHSTPSAFNVSSNSASNSIYQPHPTVFSSFVLHAKARLQHSNDLSIVLRALFASDSRYLLYQIVRDSAAVAVEAAYTEGVSSINPDHMDEILLLVLEISREIAKENDWETVKDLKPLDEVLAPLDSEHIDELDNQSEKDQTSFDSEKQKEADTLIDDNVKITNLASLLSPSTPNKEKRKRKAEHKKNEKRQKASGDHARLSSEQLMNDKSHEAELQNTQKNQEKQDADAEAVANDLLRLSSAEVSVGSNSTNNSSPDTQNEKQAEGKGPTASGTDYPKFSQKPGSTTTLGFSSFTAFSSKSQADPVPTNASLTASSHSSSPKASKRGKGKKS